MDSLKYKVKQLFFEKKRLGDIRSN